MTTDQQPTLFDNRQPPKPPDICRRRHGGNKESEAANRSVHATKSRLCELVVEALRVAPATAAELEDDLGLSRSTVSARCAELLAAGRIKRTGKRRPTRSGRSAAVLEAVIFHGLDA